MKHNVVNKKDYIGFFKKKLKYATTKEQAAYMKEMKKLNLQKAKVNPNENWFKNKLIKAFGNEWTRQAVWGYRIFDFWDSKRGVAVEIDGPEHNEEYDRYRDIYNYLRSGIVVIRVRNKNNDDAIRAIRLIKTLGNWKNRRETLGLHIYKKVDIEDPKDPYWHYDPEELNINHSN